MIASNRWGPPPQLINQHFIKPWFLIEGQLLCQVSTVTQEAVSNFVGPCLAILVLQFKAARHDTCSFESAMLLYRKPHFVRCQGSEIPRGVLKTTFAGERQFIMFLQILPLACKCAWNPTKGIPPTRYGSNIFGASILKSVGGYHSGMDWCELHGKVRGHALVERSGIDFSQGRHCSLNASWSCLFCSFVILV